MDTPPYALECKICHLPCCEAQQSECCGHVYCKVDIDQLKKATVEFQPVCPMCRVEGFVAYPNLDIDHEIQQLMVYCPDKEASGCDWIGKLKDVEEHYSYGRECETECEKCNTIVKHKLLRSHLDTECPCYCPYCDITAEREVISSEHKEKCYKFPLTCPNNCGLNNVPRDNMDGHKKECPLEMVQCEFHDIGCEAIIRRKDEESHARDAVTTHLQLAQKQLTVLNKMLEDSNARHIESSDNFTVLVSELQERIRTFEGIHTDQSSQSTKAQPVDVEVQTDVNSVNMTMVISAFFKIIWYFMMPRNSNTSILALAILLLSCALYVNYNTPTTTNYCLPTVQEFHEKVVLYELIDQSALPWPSKLYYWSNTATIVAPVVVKFSNFSMQKNSVLHSNTFFGFTNGYLLRLRIYPSGSPGRASKHLYMSVYLDYMRGPHDDKLDKLGYFPINKSFTIALLNPNDDNSHLQKEITGCNITRVTGNDNSTNYVGCGFANFVSLEGYDFMQKCTCDKANVTICCYLTDDDTIYFRIQEEPPHPIAPVISKLTKFSQWVRSKKQWDSGPFFAFNGGYQMCLKVNVAGYGDGEGTHVSAYLYLMKGSHDDELEQSGHWPLRGTFTIELLNQLNDHDHHSVIVQFYHHRCSRCTNRVLGGVIANIGRGQPQFISHDSLFDLANSGYYHDDSLIFRISYEDTELPDQVAPVTFKLNKFSQWVNSKQVWLSNAFFAFEGGYRMFLSVEVANYIENETTYVSVFLYLVRGPHDDELERSGHWPLKGIFTVELLNQLDDSDHYSPILYYIPSRGVNRVNGDEMDVVEAVVQYISHDTLFQHNGYLINDALYFRISYFANNDGTKGVFIAY